MGQVTPRTASRHAQLHTTSASTQGLQLCTLGKPTGAPHSPDSAALARTAEQQLLLACPGRRPCMQWAPLSGSVWGWRATQRTWPSGRWAAPGSWPVPPAAPAQPRSRKKLHAWTTAAHLLLRHAKTFPGACWAACGPFAVHAYYCAALLRCAAVDGGGPFCRRPPGCRCTACASRQQTSGRAMRRMTTPPLMLRWAQASRAEHATLTLCPSSRAPPDAARLRPGQPRPGPPPHWPAQS